MGVMGWVRVRAAKGILNCELGTSCKLAPAGEQGPHYNVRPIENTRTGSVANTQDHYSFPSKKK